MISFKRISVQTFNPRFDQSKMSLIYCWRDLREGLYFLLGFFDDLSYLFRQLLKIQQLRGPLIFGTLSN